MLKRSGKNRIFESIFSKSKKSLFFDKIDGNRGQSGAIGNYNEASIRESFSQSHVTSMNRGTRGFLGKVEATFARSKGSNTRKFPMR